MGYRGKTAEQERARELRAEGRTIAAIAAELGVERGAVGRWVRDVEIPRVGPTTVAAAGARRRPPNALQRAKADQIAAADAWGRERIGALAERDLLIAGTALYAGEGAKGDGMVLFTNADPAMVALFCRWLRTFFEIDETRLRVRLYLHEGLDLASAQAHWADVTGIPVTQFVKPYRARADATRRRTKHERGIAGVQYTCSSTHRTVMGLVRALLVCDPLIPG